MNHELWSITGFGDHGDGGYVGSSFVTLERDGFDCVVMHNCDYGRYPIHLLEWFDRSETVPAVPGFYYYGPHGTRFDCDPKCKLRDGVCNLLSVTVLNPN